MLACALGAFAAGVVASGPASAGTSHPRTGLTVIPPGPVSDKIQVEMRLTVRNRNQDTCIYEISFYWDRRHHHHLVHRETVAIPGGEAALARAWIATAEHLGQRRLVYRVTAEGQTVAEGFWPLEVLACDTPALPLLQGLFYDTAVITYGGYTGPQGATEQDVRDAVDLVHRLGLNVFLLGYVESSGGAVGPREGLIYYPSRIATDFIKPAHLDYDPIEAILSQADRNGMHVFLGKGRGGDLWWLWDGLDDPDRVRSAVSLGTRITRELWQNYGHHPSFYGWYFTHEMNDLPKASRYYDPLADVCHSLAPDKPVMVCPAGNPVLSPEILARSHVDIFAYQDGVGNGYDERTYQYTFDPEFRIADLDEVYGRYRAAHQGSGKHFWTDLEIWRGVVDADGSQKGFRPAPMEEVQRQIEIEAKYVDMIVAYTFSCVGGKAALAGYLGPEGEYVTQLREGYREYSGATLETLRKVRPR